MPENTARLSTALADRYRIERHLGEGGMAIVYLAEDLKHDRNVAVKALRPELAAVLGHEEWGTPHDSSLVQRYVLEPFTLSDLGATFTRPQN